MSLGRVKLFKRLLLAALLFVPPLFIMPAAQAVDAPCDTYSWTGEDDNAHLMTLPYALPLGDTTYDTVYLTTNGTLTFGTPDANFSSYPNTPSISLAGWDWVTFGPGTKLSYGVNSTGFCILWDVRPYPQSSGPITNIKLTVDVSRYPSWSGIVESTGWLPNDLRRGIRFAPNTEVVTISEAFTVNGGRPVEMQSCWDGSVIPLTSTCPPEPPPGQCWDGSTIPWNGTCPPVPPDTQCWDGSWITWSQTCPQQPPPIECWDGTSVSWDAQCPPTPPDITCWDGSVIMWNSTCPVEPTPTPTVPEPTPTASPEPTPTVEPTPTPSESPTPEPSPTPSETVSPTPTPSTSESSAPVLPTPVPSPIVTPTPSPESPLEEVIPVESPTPTPTPTAPTVDPSPAPSTVEELLTEYTEDEAIPFEVLMASGIDYSELPPDQPVTLENGVVITAEIADALQIFESPSELLSTVFTDPGKALKAISNVGADLPADVRKTAQQGTLAVVLVGQIIVGGVAAQLIRK